MSWILIPYLKCPNTDLHVSDFSRDVFPAIVVLVTVIVSLVGFVYCGWPLTPSVPSKRPYRTTTELSFLLIISLIEICSNSVFLVTGSSIILLIGFSVEIAFCVFETIYLGKAGRLAIESITHHVCTIFAIPMSLFVPRLSTGLLVQLSLSVAVGNAIICASKIIYRFDDSSSRFSKKEIGIFVSYWSSVLYRIIIPTVDVLWIMYHFFVNLHASERPGWTRLYLTSLLMLLALNYQMVYTMKRK